MIKGNYLISLNGKIVSKKNGILYSAVWGYIDLERDKDYETISIGESEDRSGRLILSMDSIISFEKQKNFNDSPAHRRNVYVIE